jgi:hypothetical protein
MTPLTPLRAAHFVDRGETTGIQICGYGSWSGWGNTGMDVTLEFVDSRIREAPCEYMSPSSSQSRWSSTSYSVTSSSR